MKVDHPMGEGVVEEIRASDENIQLEALGEEFELAGNI